MPKRTHQHRHNTLDWRQHLPTLPRKTLTALFTAITALLWLLAPTTTLSAVTAAPLYALGQLSGLIAITLLSWNFLLSTRSHLLESLLGGLDKVYQEHKHVGMTAFLLMLLHPILFIVSLGVIPQSPAAQLGAAALWIFILLIALTMAVRWIPYHIWKWTHKLMGLPFILASIHAFLSGTTIAASMPLQLWLGGFLSAGTAAYLYKVLLYRWVAPHATYTVESVQTHDDIITITLTPDHERLEYLAGQFVFVRFDDDIVSSESHPYSIASDPNDDTLRLAIKQLGDHTAQLPALSVGATATIYGPHGRFGHTALRSEKDMIWIAGGIGVTPFLSLAPALTGQPHGPARDIHCYYCTSTADQAVFADELTRFAANTGMSCNTVFSREDGRLTAERVATEVEDLEQHLIMLCGPQRMMDDLAAQFHALGVPRDQIIYESFALR